MLASSQGGINIEEQARDDPDSILTEPVDIDSGVTVEQARKVATFMGFEGDKVEQVWKSFVTSLVLWFYSVCLLLSCFYKCQGRCANSHIWGLAIGVVKTAHSFWPVYRDQKDWLTAAAYAAVKVGYMTL